MKTTLEIPDAIYRQVKARAALNGQTVRSFFLEALREKLNGQRRKAKPPAGWRSVFGKATQEEIDEVQKIIDEEFSRINPEDWK
jgi:hypothetical protein